MKKDDIIKTLPTVNDLGQEKIWLELYNCMMTIDDFLDKFGESELAFEKLLENVNTDYAWSRQFKEWYKQGILN